MEACKCERGSVGVQEHDRRRVLDRAWKGFVWAITEWQDGEGCRFGRGAGSCSRVALLRDCQEERSVRAEGGSCCRAAAPLRSSGLKNQGG